MRLKKNLLALMFVLVALPAYAQNAPGGLPYFTSSPTTGSLNQIVSYINNALGYTGAPGGVSLPVSVANGGNYTGSTGTNAQSVYSFYNGVSTVFSAQNQFVYNNDPSLLRAAQAAFSNVQANVSDAKVFFIGDSTTEGYLSSTGCNLNYPNAIAQTLKLKGINAQYDNVFGGSNSGGCIDPRLTLGSGWTVGAYASLGYMYTNTTNTNNMSFVPYNPVNACDVYYVAQTAVTGINAGFDALTPTAINLQAGTQGVGVTTITTPNLAMHTINISRTAGSVFIIGLDCYNTTTKSVHIMNGGQGGATTAGLAASGGFNYQASVALIHPVLTIIDAGINDWINAVPVATYKTNMQTIITNGLSTGSVIIVTPAPSNIASSPQATQATYVNAMYTLAQSNNVMLIDNWSRFGSWASVNALGEMADTLHPNAQGYADFASSPASVLSNMFISGPTLNGNVAIGTSIPVGNLTVNGNYATGSNGRAVNTGTTTDTIAANIASTYESANSATITLTFAAPSGDGERRKVCLKNASTVTWAVTSPATAVAGLPTTFVAGQCVEAVYNSVAGTPTNAPATSWVVY